MIAFDVAGARFNYRVVGACVHEGYALLHRAEHDDFWSLPGGRCDILEPSAEALRREMREELAVEVGVERLLWVVENFFQYGGRSYHEMALYYLISLPDGCGYLDKERTYRRLEENGVVLIYRWFPLDTLRSVRLFPSFLHEGLGDLPPSVRHVVHTDSELKG